jgi:hypothetical protein
LSIADQLWAARRSGSKVAIAESDRPRDDAEAYRLQGAVSAASGARVVVF